MSIIVLARVARPLRTSCTSIRYLSGTHTPQDDSDLEHLIAAHARKMGCLQDSHHTKIDELWEQVLSLRSAKLDRELREMRKSAKRQREREEEREWRREWKRERDESTRGLTELRLTVFIRIYYLEHLIYGSQHDKIELLHKVALYGENVSAASSLGTCPSLQAAAISRPHRHHRLDLPAAP